MRKHFSPDIENNYPDSEAQFHPDSARSRCVCVISQRLRSADHSHTPTSTRCLLIVGRAARGARGSITSSKKPLFSVAPPAPHGWWPMLSAPRPGLPPTTTSRLPRLCSLDSPWLNSTTQRDQSNPGRNHPYPRPFTSTPSPMRPRERVPRVDPINIIRVPLIQRPGPNRRRPRHRP